VSGLRCYYNEIDPHCAQWLQNLMDAGEISRGDIDTRSIEDVTPSDLKRYDQCHFFAGLGGWSYALGLADWGDRPVWTGSCPCQPFSAAGKGNGMEDQRHLWPSWQWLISVCRPPVVFGEQVVGAVKHGWLDLVASDFEAHGYAFGSAAIQASSVGAKHRRERIFFVADAEWNEQSREESRSGSLGRMGRIEQPIPWNEPWESALSRFRALGDGLPRSVAGTDAARNAIVPQAAAYFIKAYSSKDNNP
jgi:DNA (cytosine-5)-methyltransferase 1